MSITTEQQVVWPDPPIPSEYTKEWENFFKTEHAQLTPDIRKGVTLNHCLYDTGLFPLQYKRELRGMMEESRKIQPKTIMEIGCDKCASLYHFCLIPSVVRVIGCEIRGTPFSSTFEKNFPDINFCWAEASRSALTLTRVTDFLVEHSSLIDVLFIDGDKCFYTEDFDTYRPLMNDNGIVFMHDVSEGYPQEVFDKMRERGYRTSYIRDISEYNEFSQSGKEPTTAYEHWLLYWKGTSCGVGVIYLDKDGG